MMKKFNPTEEKAFLNSLVIDYKDVSPYSQIKKDIIIELIKSFINEGKSKRGLQLGCANGYETEKLSSEVGQLTVVDGASEFIEKLIENNQNNKIQYVFSLFEELSIEKMGGDKFDYIFCNYIMEHVFDTQSILLKLKELLKPDGLLFIVVPNFNALSRRIALEMGLIKSLTELTENDHRHGHRRVYSRHSIAEDIEKTGFSVKSIKGIVFKILADFQLNQLLNQQFLERKHIDALQKLAEEDENIDFSDSIFCVASL